MSTEEQAAELWELSSEECAALGHTWNGERDGPDGYYSDQQWSARVATLEAALTAANNRADQELHNEVKALKEQVTSLTATLIEARRIAQHESDPVDRVTDYIDAALSQTTGEPDQQA